MNALEYLKTLPALYINVDGYTAREEQFLSLNAHLLLTTERVAAYPLGDIVSDANDFIERVTYTRTHADQRGYLSSWKIFGIREFSSPTKRALEYAKTRSLTLSVLLAIRRGLERGYERFIVFEDDAACRLDLLESMTAPPSDGDIIVWGGAFPSGGLKRDNERYLEFEKPAWKRIHGKDRRFFAQAYEMTRAGAKALDLAIRENFFAIDMSWWYAHDAVVSYTATPAAFTQLGVSSRTVHHNADTREGSISR